MRKILLLAIAAISVCSCGVFASMPTYENHVLYNWGGWYNSNTTAYEHYAYQNYKKQTPESVCALIVTYEDMVNHPGGERGVVPPGICAEYGYLLLQPDSAQLFEQNATEAQKKVFSSSDYGALFREKGAALFEQEMELYPESALFIRPLMAKLK